MKTGNIGNRHPRPGRFLHNRQLLLCRISAPALDPGKHFYSIRTVRHSRTTRLTPSSFAMQLCPVQKGAAPDVDQTQLQRTSHQTYCPYKGECFYYSIPSGGERSVNAVWTYEAPYASVSTIQEYLAFYPDRVDAIEISVDD